MSATAAFNGKIQASTDGSSWTDVALANDASADVMRDILETTNYKNTVGVGPDKERIYGLRDASFEITASYDDSDTNGQKAIRTACINASALYVKYLPDGTHGFSCAVVVEKFSEKGPVAAIAGFTASLKKTGALTVI